MMFIIHNLPSSTRFQDVKKLLKEKCGITEIILDNLLAEGSRKKITVGLADEDDAALLVKEIDGLFVCGHQVFVEDLGKKKKLAKASLNVWENNHNPIDHKDVGLNSETEKWNGHLGNVWEVNNVPDEDRTFRSKSPEPRVTECDSRVDTNSHDYDAHYRDGVFDRDHGNWRQEHTIHSIAHDKGVSYTNANNYGKAYRPSRDDYSHNRFQDSPRNTRDFNIKHHYTPRSDHTLDEERTGREGFRNNNQQYLHNYSKRYNSTNKEYDQRDGSRRREFHEFSRSPRLEEQFTEDYKKHSYRERPSYIRPKSFLQPESSHKPPYQSHKPYNYMNIFDESVQSRINAAVSKLAQDLSKNIGTNLNMDLIVRELKKNIRQRVYDVFTGNEMSQDEIIVLYRRKYLTADDMALCDSVLQTVSREATDSKNNSSWHLNQTAKRRRY